MKIKPRLKEELKKYLLKRTSEEEKKVKIISAYKLTQEDLKDIYQNFPYLSKKDVDFAVDPELIAGIIIKQGSKLIDLSLVSRLKDLQQKAYETV